MVRIESWMETLTELLQRQLEERLCFVGLQGSYRRGEATEDSDIDVVLIIEPLLPGDLVAYRGILAALPEGEKACGFVCDRATLAAWPAQEIFQFARETVAYHGELGPLLPPFDEADISRALGMEASGLYHGGMHALLFDSPATHVDTLRALYKSSLFALQLKCYLETGSYHDTAAKLLPNLSGGDEAVLRIRMNWQEELPAIRDNPENYLFRILGWGGRTLRCLAGQEG